MHALGAPGFACRRQRLAKTAWAIATLLVALPACRSKAPPAQQEMDRGKELLRAHPDQALKEFEAAAELGGRGARLGIAAAHERLGQFADAEKVLLEARRDAPNDLDVQLALVRMRIALGKLDEARSDLQATLSRSPPHVPSRLLFAALAKTKQQGEAGAAALSALSGESYATLRDSAEYAVAEAALLEARGDEPRARERLAAATNSRSLSPQLAIALSDSLKLVGRAREAEWLLVRAADDETVPDLVNQRLASVAMDLRHLSLAERALSKLRTDFKPDPRALLLMARLYELRNDPGASARATGRALEALPDGVQVAERRRIQLAHVDALIKSGQERTAQRILRGMLEHEPRFSPVKCILAALLLGEGKGSEAVELVTPLLDEPTLASQAYPIVVAAYRQSNDMGAAEQAARRFLRQSHDAPPAATILAEVLSAQNRAGDALAVVDEALRAHPNSARLSAAKIDLVERSQGVAAAIDVATGLAAAHPGPAAELRVAALYSEHERDAEAVGVLTRLTQAYPKNTQAWADLSAAEARSGHTAQAAKALEKVVELVPFDTGALVALGTLYRKLERRDDAKRTYEAVLQVEPTSLVALNNLAVLLTDEAGQAPRAVELARRARGTAQNDPAIADTLGWALVHTGAAGDLTEALDLLRSSSGQLRAAEAYYHYGIALQRTGKKQEALTELRRALGKSEDFPGRDQAQEAIIELAAH